MPSTIAADLNGDGVSELYAVWGGRLRCLDATGRVRWQGSFEGIGAVHGAWDFDGDGRAELLTSRDNGPARVLLHNSQNGRVLWSSPAFPDGSRAIRARENIQVSDLDGDGLVDLAINPVAPIPELVAFSYSDGFGTGDDNTLWSEITLDNGNINQVVTGRFGADRELGAVSFHVESGSVFDGATGDLLGTVTWPITGRHNSGLIAAVDVDGVPGDEVVAVAMHRLGVGASVMRLDDDPLWSLDYGPRTAATAPGAQLLQNGADPELALSIFDNRDDERNAAGDVGNHDGWNQPDAWVTLVFDSATGVVRDRLPGLMAGAIDLDGNGTRELILRTTADEPAADRAGMSALGEGDFRVYSRAPDGRYAARLSLDGVELLPALSDPRADASEYFQVVDLARGPIAAGTGARALRWRDGDELVTAVMRESVAGSTFEVVSSAPIDAVDFVGTISNETPLMRDDPWALATYDASRGYLFYDGSGAEVASVPGPGQTGEVLAGSLNGSPTLAFNEGRRGVALFGDEGESAGRVESTSAGARTIALIDVDADGSSELVVAGTETGTEGAIVEAWRTVASRLWQRRITTDGYRISSLTAGTLMGTDALDIAIAVRDPREGSEADLRVRALSGVDGSSLWDSANPANTAHWPALLTSEESPSGVQHVIAAEQGGAQLFFGDTGVPQQIARLGLPLQAMRVPLGGDEDILIVGEHDEIRALDMFDGAELWSSPRNYAYEAQSIAPALAHTGGGEYAVVQPTEAGLVTARNVRTGALLWTRQLVDGRSDTTPRTFSSGLSAAATGDIEGLGVDSVLVGSDSGFLYALDAASGDLRWTMTFGAPVGSPTISGEGDSITVSITTGDRFLRGLVPAQLEPPSEVRDVELSESGTVVAADEDVDETPWQTQVGGSWEPSDGAVRYLVRLVSETGSEVDGSRGDGTGDFVVLSDLLLVPDLLYFAEVIAQDADGERSQPRRSDGFVYVPVEAIDPAPEALDRVEDDADADAGDVADADADADVDADADAGIQADADVGIDAEAGTGGDFSFPELHELGGSASGLGAGSFGEAGCGCSASTASGSLGWLLVVGLLTTRRRRA